MNNNTLRCFMCSISILIGLNSSNEQGDHTGRESRAASSPFDKPEPNTAVSRVSVMLWLRRRVGPTENEVFDFCPRMLIAMRDDGIDVLPSKVKSV